MLKRLAVAVATVSPLVCIAADFAPAGTQGTLTLKISAEGGARHKAPPRAGLDARQWSVKNTGEVVIRLKAQPPTGDSSAGNQANADAVRGMVDQAITDQDQEVLDRWDEKTSACNGNEACENRVMGQMMADPQYQRIMAKMQGAAPAIASAARSVNTGQAQQIWASDPADVSPASGRMNIDLVRKEFGVVDTGGGGKVDVTCRLAGQFQIAPGSPESKVGALVLIDAAQSRYEIRLPADAFQGRVTERCADSKAGDHGPSKNAKGVRLIGAAPPRSAKSFDQVLTVKGPVGAANSPQLSGKQSFTTDLLGSHGDPVPVKVTVEWKFSAGGR